MSRPGDWLQEHPIRSWLTGAAVVIAILFVFVIWLVPDMVVDDSVFKAGANKDAAALEAQRLEARHNARLGAAQAFAFAAVMLAALGTFRTVAQTREGQITDRFTEALGHLAHDNSNVRTGAIYALGRVAYDSRRDHPAIMSVLADHLRSTFPNKKEAGPLAVAHPDVRAVSMVLRQRRVKYDVPAMPIDLSGIDLRAAPLYGVELEQAVFTDSNLRGADLRSAKCSGSYFIRTNLTSAYLQKARFVSAKMTGACFDSAFLEDAVLQHAVLTGATFDGTEADRTDLRGAKGIEDGQLDKLRYAEDQQPLWPTAKPTEAPRATLS